MSESTCLWKLQACVWIPTAKIVCEDKIASEPDALMAWLTGLKLELTRIGLEAGSLSQWLYAAMRQAGLAVEPLETRHVRNALLEAIAQGLLAVRVTLRHEFDRFEKQVHAMARCDTRARLLILVPGVGPIVSLTFASAIDDPARFKSSKPSDPRCT